MLVIVINLSIFSLYLIYRLVRVNKKLEFVNSVFSYRFEPLFYEFKKETSELFKPIYFDKLELLLEQGLNEIKKLTVTSFKQWYKLTSLYLCLLDLLSDQWVKDNKGDSLRRLRLLDSGINDLAEKWIKEKISEDKKCADQFFHLEFILKYNFYYGYPHKQESKCFFSAGSLICYVEEMKERVLEVDFSNSINLFKAERLTDHGDYVLPEKIKRLLWSAKEYGFNELFNKMNEEIVSLNAMAMENAEKQA